MAGSALVGGVLLGLIEGLGILMNKYQAQMMRPPTDNFIPQDPTPLDLKSYQ